jgi:hypothetical protein
MIKKQHFAADRTEEKNVLYRANEIIKIWTRLDVDFHKEFQLKKTVIVIKNYY